LPKESIAPYQDGNPSSSRDERIAILTNDHKATWQGIFASYLVAYYNGNYIDRTGKAYSRPEIGTKITNDTVTALVTIFFESLGDYALLDASSIKDPVLWKASGANHSWLTATQKMPTFVSVARHLYQPAPAGSYSDDYGSVVNEAKTSTITEDEASAIRSVSGLAGDGAKSLAGGIVRFFGGIVPVAKLSVGDNQTVTQAVDAFLETVARRVSEAFLSTMAYGSGGPAAAGALPSRNIFDTQQTLGSVVAP
jgi:hypothetical protein